jgi:hypothetical protein
VCLGALSPFLALAVSKALMYGTWHDAVLEGALTTFATIPVGLVGSLIGVAIAKVVTRRKSVPGIDQRRNSQGMEVAPDAVAVRPP